MCAKQRAADVRRDDFFEVVNRLAQTARADAAIESLQGFVRAWGLHNVGYGALNMPFSGGGRPLLAMTCSPDWQRHYAQRNYIDIDPVLRAGLGGILPVDWADIDRSDPIVRRFFGEAQELDVGSSGLTVPLRGRHGEFALFTVTARCDAREWAAMRADLLRDVMVVAWNFHAAALRGCKAEETPPARLSARETSCLRWKALGKTDDDISLILGISSHTVRFHLETARARLETANTTHTVARALSLGLISLSCDPALEPQRRR